MSIIFERQDETIWEPSGNTGKLFMHHITGLEQLLELPSGIHPSMDDTYELSEEKLSAFTDALIGYFKNTDNPNMHLLIDGALVLLLRLHFGLSGNWKSEAPPALLAEAQTLSF